MKQIASLTCCLTMQKPEKFKPIDSVKNKKKEGQTVKEPQDGVYQRKDANMPDPETKRKFSEQPPTHRNSKT